MAGHKIKIRRFLFSVLLVAIAGGVSLLFHLGTLLSAPANRPVGKAPPDLDVQQVEFDHLKGWFVPAGENSSCVVLMHGLRADRRSMVARARMFRDAGYASLLFDFQAHGESAGKQITFGYLESNNARQAVKEARTKLGCNKIAALGQSLGGAAALLGQKPLNVDALIIESVYPDIEEAVADRLALHLGHMGRYFYPLLTVQLKYRMGIDPQALRPIDRIALVKSPLLLLAGGDDQHTTIEESRRLFAAAHAPKQFWEVVGAAHVDLYRFDPLGYRRHVLPFLAKYLKQGNGQQTI